MAFVRYKQRGNKWYAYEVTAFWDQESKSPKQKTKYLGVSDTKGGEILRPGKKSVPAQEKSIVDFGDSYALAQLAENCGFSEILRKTIGNFDSVMALTCYQLTEGAAMYNCLDWAEGNICSRLFPEAKLRSQDISRLLDHLGREDVQRSFFRAYVEKFFNGSHSVLIDSTALPSSINTP